MMDNIAHGRIKAMGRHFRQTCPRDWDRGRMVGFGGTLRAYIERDEKITRALNECFHLVPRDDQGPLFFRPNWYLTASLVEANKPHEETMAIIFAIIQFMETLKDFYKQRACEDESVRRCARDWFKTVGR
jgi:hypothetical protein